MSIPNDPFILYSYVNTALRDKYSSLEEFCRAEDVDQADLTQKLSDAGFAYDEQLNRFG